MLEGPQIEVQDVTGRIEGDAVILDVKAFNTQDRTLYAYGSPRRIVYDDATHTLTVSLHDHHVDPDHPVAPHLPQPRFVSLEGGTVTDIAVRLPRVVRGVRAASERAGGAMVEELPVSEATKVTVEVAHQDTPFYFNPRMEKTEQLREWGQHVTKITTEIHIAPEQGKKASPEG